MVQQLKSNVFFVVKNLCSLALIALLFGYTCAAVCAEVNQTLSQIESDQKKLNDLKNKLSNDLESAQKLNADNVQDLLQRQALADQFIFDNAITSELREKTRLGQTFIQQSALDDAQKVLLPVGKKYKQLLGDFDLITQSVEAERQAEKTKVDSKMYFMMRKRQTRMPPKTLKAYGVMELAKRNRDQGDFSLALQQWARSEQMVKDSINELIATQTKWLEDAKRNAAVEKEKIKLRVEDFLQDHFVAIPAGSFEMGSENGGFDEMPVHTVGVPAFKMGKTEVTFELWDLCVESTSCFVVPKDHGWGRGDKPVINVSYNDITRRFIPWLNKLTGNKYRLPSEAEWEYAARAGSRTEYCWGNNALCSLARYDGGVSSVCNAREGENKGTARVKNYEPNVFGLYDMHGNVWEWVKDCWNSSYEGAPSDGSPWLTGNCTIRVLRGGSWSYPKSSMRLANRHTFSVKARKPGYGFRLVVEGK